MFKFAPGCCCDQDKPEAVCLYTGKYSDSKLLQLLDTDYRSDTTRPLPWWYRYGQEWQRIYAWPAVPDPDKPDEIPEPSGLPPYYACYSYAWTLPAVPTSYVPDEQEVSLPSGASPHLNLYDDNERLTAAGFADKFGGGLTQAAVYSGSMGTVSNWYRSIVPIGTTSAPGYAGSELPYHSWYLQILLYSTSAGSYVSGEYVPWSASGIAVTCRMCVMPLDHATGTASAYYATLATWCANAKYMSVALVPWSPERQQVCLTDCGLYTCSCANNTNLRTPTEIVPYGTPLADVDGNALADELEAEEVYPSGNYYVVTSTNSMRPWEYLAGTTGGKAWQATHNWWALPTAADFRALDDLKAYLNSGWTPQAYYCGIYRCGTGQVVDPDNWEIVPEGAVYWVNNPANKVRTIYEPLPRTDETCPPHWPGPTNCKWALTTARKWAHCSTCRVIECRCPAALANVTNLGVSYVRTVTGADYVEVRSGVCNYHCRQWSLSGG